MMVWHILKKDLRLLWPLVAGLTLLQVLLAIARFSAGIFLNGLPTVPVAFLQILAAAVVIVLVVHQDPIPGTRQDWLVRPIARRDLFLAKLLFVILFVQGPWWLTDLLQGLANGFPFDQSAAAASACAVWVLLTLSLPVLAFSALTSTMTETLIAATGAFALVVAFLIAPALVGASQPATLTGFAWVMSLVRTVLIVLAAAAALVLQYRWRRTWTGRALFAVALIAAQSASFMPWRTTLRLEQLLTASTGGDQPVAIAFAPGEGRLLPPPGQGLDDVQEKPGFGPVDVAAENRRRRAEGARTVFFPVRVSGLITDSRLLADRSEVRLRGRDGRIVYRGTGNDLELRSTGAEAIVHQGIRVPGALYERLNSEPLDVELDYSFTMFRADAVYALPALDGDRRMPGIGWCATRVDEAGTHVLFRCLQPGERPSCLAVVLEHSPSRQQNPEVSLCAPDYSPYPGHTFPDALSRFGGRLPFYDPSGIVHYPVGGSRLAEARVLVTDFRPMHHFIRRITIPAVRLEDWEPQTPFNSGPGGLLAPPGVPRVTARVSVRVASRGTS